MDNLSPAPNIPLSIIVVGASGDLAHKKIFPALFALYCQGYLPEAFNVTGFARRPMETEEFRNSLAEHLTCRYAPGESCAEKTDGFLSRCTYVRGEYGSRDDFLTLFQSLRGSEGPGPANRIFYMAIPPFLFLDVARSLGDTGLVSCDSTGEWSRVVIEKPFGRDRNSSDELVASMSQVFTEDQTYRIDHYLGKELVQDLLVLRFANPIFDPLWNRSLVESVRILWQEEIGVEGRGGYFDQYGIIRDVMQNHLLQILALVTMERPASLAAKHVRDEKVKVLSTIAPVRIEDVALGQYATYVEEPDVSANSPTPTFAATVLHSHSPRWQGVPFLLWAGKGLDTRFTEIRIRFRAAPENLFRRSRSALPPNELVIRVQPDEAIYFDIVNKAPGLDMKLVESSLNLRYESAFSAAIPDAYECLLLDVIRGDKGLFIRWDELAAAWDIFTPALDEIERHAIQPDPYPFGGKGPARAFELAQKHGILWA